MSNLSSTLGKVLASAVVTAAAMGGNVIAATCAGAKCGPKQSATKCGACKASGDKTKATTKAKAKAKCGACKAKCGACAAKK